MSLEITQRPIVDISTEQSAWNAVGNPILYKLQRKDYEVSVFETSGIDDFLMLRFTGVNLTATFPIGTIVTFKSDDGQYNDTAEVSLSIYSTGDTLVILDYNFEGTGAYGGGANIDANKPNYRVEINLYGPGSGDELLTENPFVYSPDTSGLVNINVSAIVRSLLSEDIDLDLSVDYLEVNNNAFKEFRLGYTEVWTESAEVEVIDTESVYGVLTALQIPSAYGGNMAIYDTFEDANPKGLFLTKLSRPKLWKDYPFIIAAIIGENVTGEVYFSVQYFNVVGDVIGSQGTAEAVYTGSLMNFIPNNFLAPPEETTSGRLWVTNNDTSQNIIDYLYFDVPHVCSNPVYLLGNNSLGGIIEQIFDGSQEYTHDYGDGRKAKRLVLTAENLTINEWEALQDFIGLGEVYKNNIVEFTSETIKTSSRIGSQVYQVFPDGSKIGVIVIPTQNTTLTRYTKHSFEIEIEYPEEFTA